MPKMSPNLDLHGRRRERRQLLGHALPDSSEHRGSAGEDDVRVPGTSFLHTIALLMSTLNV